MRARRTRLNLKPANFDVLERNKAFASQVLACLRDLGIPDDAGHVNPTAARSPWVTRWDCRARASPARRRSN
jgi:hypothetical protein